jgi:hypothetical protein
MPSPSTIKEIKNLLDTANSQLISDQKSDISLITAIQTANIALASLVKLVEQHDIQIDLLDSRIASSK